jgi:hypothetical protein
MTADDARRLALALPETVEQGHHGRPSFRVAGKIFATIWDEPTMNVMGIHHRTRPSPRGRGTRDRGLCVAHRVFA